MTNIESDKYILHTCKLTDHNIILRKSDNAICYLSDLNTNLISENVETLEAFDLVVDSFTFLNIVTEKQA